MLKSSCSYYDHYIHVKKEDREGGINRSVFSDELSAGNKIASKLVPRDNCKDDKELSRKW